jgi:Xaa-Pro aminopeptidase
VYISRRKKLLSALHEKYPHVRDGIILLFAGLENEKYSFRQESSFHYLTGINEPGYVYLIRWTGEEILYAPNYGESRSQWVALNKPKPEVEVRSLGETIPGYWLRASFQKEYYSQLIQDINESRPTIFSLLDRSNNFYFKSIYLFEKICSELSFNANFFDMSPEVATLRRKKDKHELGLMQKAIDVTCLAQEAIAQIIRPGIHEYELQAEAEKVFTINECKIAFPTIIASGENSTVLHYSSKNRVLKDDDVVIVDIGAEYDYYCADITRTFSVNKFCDRQKEVYGIVSEVQQYISEKAKPGFFLNNPEHEDCSLHHIAKLFLNKRGYDKYFVHGIGHFLGLDVHDVGDRKIALSEGDVITIEPGIYIPDEHLGVRIEDDYLITNSGCRKLSKRHF